MQSLMFVFVGLAGNNSDASVPVLMERLEEKFAEKDLALHFEKKRNYF